jgi:signal peptidase II
VADVAETAGDSGRQAAPSAMHAPVTWRYPRAWAILVIVTVLGTGIDLWTKHLAFQHIAGVPVEIDRERVLETGNPSRQIPFHRPVVVVPGLLEFTLVANRGAVFGMGAGKRVLFIVFTCIALGFGLLLFATWTTPKEWVSHAAIGLLLAGGLGNLYDRWVYACVRDFIHPLPGRKLPFGWSYPWGGNEVWPYVSNVADLFLIIGIGVLVVRAVRTPSSPARAAMTGSDGTKDRTTG